MNALASCKVYPLHAAHEDVNKHCRLACPESIALEYQDTYHNNGYNYKQQMVVGKELVVDLAKVLKQLLKH